MVNLDHVQTVSKARLGRTIGQLDQERMREVCRALEIAVGCSE